MQRFPWNLLSGLLILGLASVAGCGEDKGSGIGETAETTDTGTATEFDSGTFAETDSETGSQEEVVCDHSGISPTSVMAAKSDFHIEYAGYELQGETSRELRVQIYGGDFGGPTEPGTYSLEGLNYADCGLCVLAYEGCTGTTCEKAYFARSGSVEITALGDLNEPFAATLHDVVLEEVTIDPESFESTPVEGGETWCADGHSFDETLSPYITARCADPWLTCTGDIIKDFELANCESEEMVSLSELALGQKALWLVLVTGWCPTCKEWVPMVVDMDDQYAEQGLEVVYVLGENAQTGQPTAEYCREYASQYTEPARFFLDHDGTYSFATVFANMWPYISDDGMFGVPWNAAIDPATLEYVYGDGLTETSEIETYINELLGI